MEELKNWIKENPLAFGGVLSLMFFCLWGLFGFGSSKGLGLAV